LETSPVQELGRQQRIATNTTIARDHLGHRPCRHRGRRGGAGKAYAQVAGCHRRVVIPMTIARQDGRLAGMPPRCRRVILGSGDQQEPVAARPGKEWRCAVSPGAERLRAWPRWSGSGWAAHAQLSVFARQVEELT